MMLIVWQGLYKDFAVEVRIVTAMVWAKDGTGPHRELERQDEW